MLSAELQSKHPHDTFFLQIKSDAKLPPKLIADLEKAGWKPSPSPSALDGEVTAYFSSPGTDLFGGWTAEERKAKVLALKTVIKTWCLKLGVRKLDTSDLA